MRSTSSARGARIISGISLTARRLRQMARPSSGPARKPRITRSMRARSSARSKAPRPARRTRKPLRSRCAARVERESRSSSQMRTCGWCGMRISGVLPPCYRKVPFVAALTFRHILIQLALNPRTGSWSDLPMRRLTWLLLVACAAARAEQPFLFVVTDIRVEGLQRIAEGTLLNALPVSPGDTLDAQRVREALRAIHQTGFFRDVELRREVPGVLIVVVQENPSIRSFAVSGNKDIKSEDLLKSLRGVGLADGRIFDRSTLEEVRQYLTEQYFARGRYAVRVDARVEEVGGNLVDVHVDNVEGKRARIRRINIVGNRRFS